MDHFTFNIIRNELLAITSRPPPEPKDWAFVPLNDYVFSPDLDESVTPEEWLERGLDGIKKALY
jgi:hypothetical protein